MSAEIEAAKKNLRRPTFQLVFMASGALDMLSIDHRGHWVGLGIDGGRLSPLLADRLALDCEATACAPVGPAQEEA